MAEIGSAGGRGFTIASAKRAPLLTDGNRFSPRDCRPNTTTLGENRFHTRVLHMRPPARDCHGAFPWACLIMGVAGSVETISVRRCAAGASRILCVFACDLRVLLPGVLG